MELVEIAYFPSYIINNKGIVLENETLEKVKPDKNKKLCLINYQGNIEFVTPEELLALTFIGSMPCKIINSYNLDKIGSLINKGISNNSIAKKLNLSESFIRGIKIGKFKLNNDNSIYLRNNSCSKLKDKQVRDICKLLIEGELTQFQIGKIFGVSEDIISNIKNKRTYKNITNDYF